MATKVIQFIGLIDLHGNSYLQFKIDKEYFIYKYYCQSVARKIKYQVQFSSWKALNQARIKCNSWWKERKQWDGWSLPNKQMEPDPRKQKTKEKPVQTQMQMASILHT
jgi:hypothetical protein